MDKFSKCIWLATVILKSGNQGVTLREINQQWQYAFDADPIPRKTFSLLINPIFNPAPFFHFKP